MQDHASHETASYHQATNGRHYTDLALEITVHFIIMYLVMYTMIATLAHFYLNINNVWMTGHPTQPDEEQRTQPRAALAVGAQHRRRSAHACR